MQDLVVVIQNSTPIGTGVHSDNANSSGLESSISNVNFNGRVKLTAQGKTDAYGIYQATGKNSSSELKFMRATDLETIAEGGSGYGLYSLVNGSKFVDDLFEVELALLTHIAPCFIKGMCPCTYSPETRRIIQTF